MFSPLRRYAGVFTALGLSLIWIRVKRRKELASGEGSPHQGAPGAQPDYWFPVCCPERRLCSNIMGILGCFNRASERKTPTFQRSLLLQRNLKVAVGRHQCDSLLLFRDVLRKALPLGFVFLRPHVLQVPNFGFYVGFLTTIYTSDPVFNVDMIVVVRSTERLDCILGQSLQCRPSRMIVRGVIQS